MKAKAVVTAKFILPKVKIGLLVYVVISLLVLSGKNFQIKNQISEVKIWRCIAMHFHSLHDHCKRVSDWACTCFASFIYSRTKSATRACAYIPVVAWSNPSYIVTCFSFGNPTLFTEQHSIYK